MNDRPQRDDKLSIGWKILIGCMVVFLIVGFFIADDEVQQEFQTECRAHGGAYLTRPFLASQCWTSDGRRVFGWDADAEHEDDTPVNSGDKT